MARHGAAAAARFNGVALDPVTLEFTVSAQRIINSEEFKSADRNTKAAVAAKLRAGDMHGAAGLLYGQ
jgi:hypothetical protein